MPVCCRPECALSGVDQPSEAFHARRSRKNGGLANRCAECERKRLRKAWLDRKAAKHVDGLMSQAVTSRTLPIGQDPDFSIDVEESVYHGHDTSIGHDTHATTDADKPKTIALASDIHWPLHDPELFGAFLDWLRDTQPHEVILTGDFGDWASVSRFEEADRPKFLEDVAAVRWGIEKIRAASPDSTTTAMLGNHDGRLEKWLGANASALAGAIDTIKAINLPGVNWIARGRRIRRGSLKLLHGDQLHGGGQYKARKLVDIYGTEPGITVACGHFHRHQTMTRAFDGGQTTTGVLLPCMSRLDMEYLQDEEVGWAQGFGVAYVRSDGRTALNVIRWEGGGFVAPNGKFYAGRAEVYKP